MPNQQQPTNTKKTFPIIITIIIWVLAICVIGGLVVKSCNEARSAKEQEEIHRREAEKAYRNEVQLIEWINPKSPRGKCESRCKKTYTQNTDSFDICMNVCKDMRSGI